MRTIRLPSNRRIRLAPQPRPSNFFHLHAHSRYSAKDALSPVKKMVETAVAHGQPALALTDHGNMGGAVKLYQECKKAGIKPFTGIEAYLKRDKRDKSAKRYHVGLVAFTAEGYEALVALTTRSFTRADGNFHHYPHVDFTDFSEWSERGWTDGIALTTGCYFGLVQQTLIEQGNEAAEWLIKTLAQWFPYTYVELQHHNIFDEDHDDNKIVSDLDAIARRIGLPTVITQDAHYCTLDEKPQHETLKQLVSWSDDPSEAKFPGDGFHLSDDRFVRNHFVQPIWERGLEGLEDLLDRHDLYIRELEHYSYNVPIVTADDPMDELRDRVLKTMDLNGLTQPRYLARFEEEMEVVEVTDMAGYLMLTTMVCDHMREQGIFYQTRGSASGSLLCWLLGITQHDPVSDDLRYERFLSKDRTKPPDIDLDVEDLRRQEVIDWLSQRFNVCQIGTWAEFSVDVASGRGSLLVAYLSRKRKEGMDPAWLNSIKGLHDLPSADRKELISLGRHKAYKSYGTHAGGLVVTSTSQEFERLVPTMLVASSDTVVTQYDDDDVEALGLVKLDVLGQKSLTTLRVAHELLGRDVADGWDWMPLDDKATYRAIRQQKVDGVFQLEGWTNRKGCKEMRPKRMRDLIHLVSLYRPATIETGMKDAYINRMRGWEGVPERHPILMHNLKETYGVPVFQDQVIGILRDLGFTPDELTEFLKAVKASNENIGDAAKVIERYEEHFVNLAGAAGWDATDVEFTWDAIEGFAKYGFNKAHATAYGHRAYYMAYLRTHHPLEFFTSLLRTWAGDPKERDYVIVTKQESIPILKPDVNISGRTWSIDRTRGAIRKGLVSVKGVGEKAASEIELHAPFVDIDDLIDRCEARAVNGGKNWNKDGTLNGVLGKLKDVGALKSLGL